MAGHKRKNTQPDRPKRMGKGFVRTGGLLSDQIRRAGEKRGFVETRLLTHWPEIVGEDLARISRPIKVHYGRQGFGATLTVLVHGAVAPMFQADEPRIRERVNACYGYSAISKIRLTQTAETGFAEPPAPFAPPPVRPDPAKSARLTADLAPVGDPGLRAALAELGENILTKPRG